jgi:hypothetical protein
MSSKAIERLRALLLAAATAAVFIAWAPRLGPAPEYNSDVGVPVLAANSEPLGAFFLYYPMQDRLGGWPTLLARELTPVTGPWDPHRMHLLLLVIVLSAVVPVARLAGPLAGLGYLLACAWPPTVTLNLAYHQPYGAQLATLLWAWWAMRRAADARSPAWLGVACALALLSCWSSPASGLLLALAAVAEMLRTRALGHAARPTALRLFLPAVAGAVGEGAIRIAYRAAWVRAGWGNLFRMRYRLDRGHLWENAQAIARRLGETGGAVLVGVGLVAGGLALLHLWRRRGRADEAAVVLGAALGSAATWAIIVGVEHVRLNFYSPRYLAPAIALAGLATWTLAAVVAAELLKSLRAEVGLAAFAAAALAVAVWSPRSAGDPSEPWGTTARALAAEAPGGVLLADYWSCYALAALVPHGMLEPMTPDSEQGRFPNRPERLRTARVVVVGSEGPLLRPPGSPAPAELCQYGVRLTLLRPDLGAPGRQRFALYAPAGSCVR